MEAIKNGLPPEIIVSISHLDKEEINIPDFLSIQKSGLF